MNVLNSLNSIDKLIWLIIMAVAFIFFWPAGLAILIFLAVTGRLGSFGSKLSWAPQTWVTSGNAAFDEHRAETLEALKAEQEAFGEFIENVAKAKDRAEF